MTTPDYTIYLKLKPWQAVFLAEKGGFPRDEIAYWSHTQKGITLDQLHAIEGILATEQAQWFRDGYEACDNAQARQMYIEEAKCR